MPCLLNRGLLSGVLFTMPSRGQRCKRCRLGHRIGVQRPGSLHIGAFGRATDSSLAAPCWHQQRLPLYARLSGTRSVFSNSRIQNCSGSRSGHFYHPDPL